MYIKNWPNKSENLIHGDYHKYHGGYLHPHFLSWIDKSKVQTILEIGSRDAIDAIELSEYYEASVYAFECNPEGISLCQHNIGNNPNVKLVPLAAWKESTSLSFYPVVGPPGTFPNIGASSLFQSHPTCFDYQVQSEIKVQAVRLDEWMAENHIVADLVCIDAQGATIEVMQGLEKALTNIKYIIAEANIKRYYLKEHLHPEIISYFTSKGFFPIMQIIGGDDPAYTDVLFVRKDLLKVNIFPAIFNNDKGFLQNLEGKVSLA